MRGEVSAPDQCGAFDPLISTPRPQSIGLKRPKSGSTPSSPGNWTLVISACVSGATSVGAQQLARERQHVAHASRACQHPGARPDRAPARAARTPPRARSRRTASRRGPRGAHRAPGTPRSSRSAAGPAAAIGTSPSNGRPDACARRCRTVEPGGPAGSSRSTVALLRRDEHRERGDGLRDRGQRHGPVACRRASRASPRPWSRRPRRTGASQSSIWKSACTPGDTRPVERRLISGHSPYEPVVGFSRAVVVGPHVSTSRARHRSPPTAPRHPTPHTSRPRLCLEIIGEALDARRRDVRRRRAHEDLPHRPGRLEEIARAHGEVFGEIRPAATASSRDCSTRRWKVEIEAEAVCA